MLRWMVTRARTQVLPSSSSIRLVAAATSSVADQSEIHHSSVSMAWVEPIAQYAPWIGGACFIGAMFAANIRLERLHIDMMRQNKSLLEHMKRTNEAVIQEIRSKQ
jgi:hypothetical protein